ncbi:hypothetical protein V5J34_004900 [Endozoicomonas sp. NE35]
MDNALHYPSDNIMDNGPFMIPTVNCYPPPIRIYVYPSGQQKPSHMKNN